MDAKWRLGRWAVLMTACAAAAATAGDQPTTRTRSLTEDVGSAVRERLAGYQPLVEQLRKRSSNELQKLWQWEYKVISVKTSDADALTAELNKWGEQGWECFHVVSAAPPAAGSLPAEHLLFLRKHKGSWLNQIPIRDVLRLFMFLGSLGGEKDTSPGPGGP